MGCVGIPKAGGHGFVWGEGEAGPKPLLLGPGLEGLYYLPVLPPSQNPLPLREGGGTGGSSFRHFRQVHELLELVK